MGAILIIETDAATRIAMELALARAGFAVAAAAEAGEAIRLAARLKPALVIADFGLVERDAFPAARFLALRKPFTASELLGAVRRHLAV